METSNHTIMQKQGLSCNKQSCETDKYQTIKVLTNICDSESCLSEQSSQVIMQDNQV